MRISLKSLVNIGLGGASVLLSLVAMEVGARVLEGAGFWDPPDEAVVHAPSGFNAYQRLTLERIFERYVQEIDGMRQKWFFETPAFPAPKPSSPELAVLADRHKKKGKYSPNAWKLYNVGFFTDYYCNDRRGWVFPDPVFFYGPYDGDPHPLYRFPPNITTPSGLVANRYGWKGFDIPPDKPNRTIRIAFLGASTTISGHSGHSYSDYINHWLNLWARENGHDLLFEVINTGHETYRSMDTAAVVEKELIPLEPDIAVYYEGANQFRVKKDIIGVPWAYLPDPVDKVLDSAGVYKVSALLRLVRRVLPLFINSGTLSDGLTEPVKPSYIFVWPEGLDRDNPDISRLDLPLHLPEILLDLKRIQNQFEKNGAELVIASFIWMVFDGMVVDPVTGKGFFEYTNKQLWPLTYKDARKLADFQNRVFRLFAEKNGVTIIDIAGKFPQELALFTDTIHMTQAGLRLRGWLTLQDLLPIIRAKIENGTLPRSDRARLRSHPVFNQTVKNFKLNDLVCVSDGSSHSGYRVKVDSKGKWLDEEMER